MAFYLKENEAGQWTLIADVDGSYVARGHLDEDEMRRLVATEDGPPGECLIEREYWHAVPSSDGEHPYYYWPHDEPGRGRFPVTILTPKR